MYNTNNITLEIVFNKNLKTNRNDTLGFKLTEMMLFLSEYHQLINFFTKIFEQYKKMKHNTRLIILHDQTKPY